MCLQWMPIETAYKNGTKFLVYNPDTELPEVAWIGSDETYPLETVDYAYTLDWAEWWMPIPPKPKGWT